MLYRRKRYKVSAEAFEPFNAFFRDYLLPVQLSHGARLVGRWVTEDHDEIMALWSYRDQEEYGTIEALVRSDPRTAEARARRKGLEPLYREAAQDFLEETGGRNCVKTSR